MPLKKYGVLKGHIVGRQMERNDPTPHFQVRADDGQHHYRLSINVKSKESPSELLYLVVEDFDHPILADLPGLSRGFTELNEQDSDPVVDFIRGNLFNPDEMITLPHDVPGPDNDLNEKIDAVVQQAICDDLSIVYAFGEPWGPDSGSDKVFGFSPKRGIHDIHMNQGNHSSFAHTDGIWQDGALFIWLPTRNRWVGIFLAFQSQSWHTDSAGHSLPMPPPDDGEPTIPAPDDDDTGEPVIEPVHAANPVRIVAARVNPFGGSPEDETVTLINFGPIDIDLAGWTIADRLGHSCTLDAVLQAGAARVIHLPQDVQLGNKGGTITLLNQNSLKVHGVSYTKKQAKREGWTILF